MKRKIVCSLIVMFVCCTTNVFGQWAVTDPALTSLTQLSWAKQLSEAAKQYGVLDKSKNILGESLDLYKKVNGIIKNSKTVANVLQRQAEMLKISSVECTRSDIYIPAEAYTEYKNVINNIMDDSLISFDLVKDIISPSVQMTDGERLRMIVDLDAKLKENENRLKDERQRFNTVNDAVKRIAALKSKPKK